MSDSDENNDLSARRKRLNTGMTKNKKELDTYESNAYMDDDDDERSGLSGSYSTENEK